MEQLNYFDLIAAIIILLLGLKGVLNGFFKELFGLIGIIGGIFVASRVGDSVGEYLNNLIFNFSSPAAVSFMGFLLTLATFWLSMVMTGHLFKKLSALSGLGAVDKILGFLLGASKFFLIAAVIANALYNVNTLRSTVDSAMHESKLFPILVETGDFIMKIDPVRVGNEINASVEKGTQVIQEKTKELVDASVKEQMDKIQDKLKEE